MMPGIIISFVFSEQRWLIVRTAPVQYQLACPQKPLDDCGYRKYVGLAETVPKPSETGQCFCAALSVSDLKSNRLAGFEAFIRVRRP